MWVCYELFLGCKKAVVIHFILVHQHALTHGRSPSLSPPALVFNWLTDKMNMKEGTV